MISLNTDISNLILINSLNSSTAGLNTAIEHLTSGYKLNHAKDNAAGLSIVTNLSTKISSLLKVKNNTEDGISLLSTAEGALENIQGLLGRLKELSTQAANGTYGKQSLDAMQKEADAIIEQIKQIRENTEFNGLKLFEAPLNSPVTKLANAKVQTASRKSRAAAPMALAADSTISGAFDIGASETKTITIDGVNYTIKNKESVAKTLSYSKDTATGELTLYSNYLEIRGEENKAHNLKIIGNYNDIYGGNLNDTIYITGPNARSSVHNNVYGGDGDDTLISSCYDNKFWGQGGNDTFDIQNGSRQYCYGGDGDDIFNVANGYETSGIYLYGEADEDKFYIKSNSKIYVDGGAGTNYAEGMSNTTLINVPNANAYAIEFNSRETKTVTINGLNYTIQNTRSAANTFMYSITADGAIDIKSKEFSVSGDKNQKHNVILSNESITYYAGDMGDTISGVSSTCLIYGGNGDDIISIYDYSTVFTGEGNNTITIANRNGNNNVRTGNGNNTVIILGANAGKTSCFEFGSGNNTIKNANYLIHSSICGGGGTNTLEGGNTTDCLIYGFGDKDNASIIEVPKYNSSTTFTVNNINYTVTRRNNSIFGLSNLLYRYNSVTGNVEFSGSQFKITGEANAVHNVVLQGGKNLEFHGGDLDDNITNYAYASYIYGEGGNDTITNTYTGDCYVYGGDGDDILNIGKAYTYGGNGDDIINVLVESSAYTINGEDGNDTYNLNYAVKVIDNLGNNIYNINASGMTVSGGAGNDTFYMKGNNNIILGGGGNDYIVIDGSNNTVDGGTGSNIYVDNGTNTNLSNAEFDPNSDVIVFTSTNEVKTVELDGKIYTIKNQNAAGTAPQSNQIRYSFNPNTGVITFDGSDFTITSEINTEHKLNIRGSNNTVNGGNLTDIITIEQGSNNIINTLAGDDVINMDSENNAVNAGDGNDTINLNASTNKLIDSGNGDDIININSSNNTNINSGAGNDKININGANNNIQVNQGDNNIAVRNDNNTINAGNGNNNFSIVGDSNSITAGNGNNKVGIEGNSNNINVTKAEGNISIYGNNNSYTSQTGEEKFVINGSSNEINSGADNDKFEVLGSGNTLTAVSGNNNASIRGDNNNFQGGSGSDTVTVSGNSNNLQGGNSNNSFTVSRGDDNVVNGGTGDRSTLIDYGNNTNASNVVNITPSPFELKLKVDLGTGESSFINLSISFNLFDFYIDFSNPANLQENIVKIDELNSQIDKQLVNIGSLISRLSTVLESQTIQMENLISSRSTLQDADIAKESSDFIKYQILQNASATLMASTRDINTEFILGILTSI